MAALARHTPVAVIGAGTMGAGIAQVAAAAGHIVHLSDTRVGAAEFAIARIADELAARVARGKASDGERADILARLRPGDAPSDCGLAIEAIVEDLAAKCALFADLEKRLSATAILATNTSSISITAIAAALDRPERCAGFHFFNPAPAMRLVEIVAGAQSGDAVLADLVDTARAWGKDPVRVRSTPGFVVNRVARPYYGEALRLLEEGAADPATLDAALVEGWGFRLGPCALMDLIGHDVNAAVTRSVFEAFDFDPRYRPSRIQRELVDAGWLGRKSGRGFFRYDRPLPQAATAPGTATAQALALDGECAVDGIVVAPTDGRLAAAVAVERGRPTVLFDVTRAGAKRMALCASPDVPDAAFARIVGGLAAAGIAASRVADRPGLVVARTLAMLINEACEAELSGIADADGIDAAMVGGVNYPGGPFEWGRALGFARVLRLLENVHAATGDARYRPSLGLRLRALANRRDG